MPVATPRFMHQVGAQEQGMRLDHFLVLQFPDLSRSELTRCIRRGHVLINDAVVKPGYKLHFHDTLQAEFPTVVESTLVAEPVPFDLLYEDAYLLIISKPPGVVVHPAAGHASGTLVNGLLYRFGDIQGQESCRPGIVHRLDKDTSGIMVVARTEKVQRMLSQAFKDRAVSKTYHAVLLRRPTEMEGRIVTSIGRHPVNRKKMSVCRNRGKHAVTRWKVLEVFTNGMCFVELVIETGRTHQIRVHMSSLSAPVAGDALYGGKIALNKEPYTDRQMLHSSTIAFLHPVTGEEQCFTAPLWPDMEAFVGQLRREFCLEE